MLPLSAGVVSCALVADAGSSNTWLTGRPYPPHIDWQRRGGVLRSWSWCPAILAHAARERRCLADQHGTSVRRGAKGDAATQARARATRQQERKEHWVNPTPIPQTVESRQARQRQRKDKEMKPRST